MKFKIGDKVVPHTKTTGFYKLNESVVWHRAKDNYRKFIYVCRYDRDFIVCDSYLHNGLLEGDYFNESDLTLYKKLLED